MFTFYRQDLFQKFNLTVPRTWEGLLATARGWQETQPVRGVAPFCMSQRTCKQLAACHRPTARPPEPCDRVFSKNWGVCASAISCCAQCAIRQTYLGDVGSRESLGAGWHWFRGLPIEPRPSLGLGHWHDPCCLYRSGCRWSFVGLCWQAFAYAELSPLTLLHIPLFAQKRA